MPFYGDIDDVEEVEWEEGAWARIGARFATIKRDSKSSFSVFITDSFEDARRVATNDGRGYSFIEAGLLSVALAVSCAKARLSRLERKRKLEIDKTPEKQALAAVPLAGAAAASGTPGPLTAPKQDVACGGDPFEELSEEKKQLESENSELRAKYQRLQAAVASKEAEVAAERASLLLETQKTLDQLAKLQKMLTK